MKCIKLLTLSMLFSTNCFAYDIATCVDLESIGKGENYPGASHTDAWPLDGTYSLVGDIDCEGKEFDQIAPNSEAVFVGLLNGNGFTIKNVTGKNGLFGFTSAFAGDYLTSGSGEKRSIATFSNLKLLNFHIDTSREYVGLLFDYADTVDLTDIEISDSSIMNLGNYTGLVGGYANVAPTNDITVENSSVSGLNYVGGVFGASNGLINYTYVMHMDVSGEDYVGGVSGYHNAFDFIGHLSSRFSTISGVNYVGGIFGQFGDKEAWGMNIIASDQNIILGTNHVGGLAGKTSASSNSQVYSTSTIVSVGDYVGGLYGEWEYIEGNHISLYSAYFSGSLTASAASSQVGRIVGKATPAGSAEAVSGITVTNTYYYDNQEWLSPVESNIGEEPATYNNFTDIDWYFDTLGFSSYNWTFYNPLDPEHGPWMKK